MLTVDRIKSESDWCEGVTEVEEIRQVDGQLVRKLIFLNEDISDSGTNVSTLRIQYNHIENIQLLENLRVVLPEGENSGLF